MEKEKFYLCLDCQGGLCDKICKGETGVIAYGKLILKTWLENQLIKNYEEVLINTKDDNINFKQAIAILNMDNYDIIELNKNEIHALEDNVIITDLKTHLHTSKFIVINPFNVEYDENGLFTIY